VALYITDLIWQCPSSARQLVVCVYNSAHIIVQVTIADFNIVPMKYLLEDVVFLENVGGGTFCQLWWSHVS
jgi:hypothetical protein